MLEILLFLFIRTAKTTDSAFSLLSHAVSNFTDDIVDKMVDILECNIIPRIQTFKKLYGEYGFEKKFLVEKDSKAYVIINITLNR